MIVVLIPWTYLRLALSIILWIDPREICGTYNKIKLSSMGWILTLEVIYLLLLLLFLPLPASLLPQLPRLGPHLPVETVAMATPQLCKLVARWWVRVGTRRRRPTARPPTIPRWHSPFLALPLVIPSLTPLWMVGAPKGGWGEWDVRCPWELDLLCLTDEEDEYLPCGAFLLAYPLECWWLCWWCCSWCCLPCCCCWWWWWWWWCWLWSGWGGGEGVRLLKEWSTFEKTGDLWPDGLTLPVS